jgi:hypothetical protein
LGNHAVLRRECFRRNLNLVFFEVVGVNPRRCIEEGGTLCVSPSVLGNFLVSVEGGFVNLNSLKGELLSYNM